MRRDQATAPATLVKVLDITQDNRTLRDRILSDNARQLLKMG